MKRFAWGGTGGRSARGNEGDWSAPRAAGGRSAQRTALVLAVLLVSGCGIETRAPDEVSSDAPVRTDPFRVAADFDGASMVLSPCGNPEEDVRVVPGPEALDLAALQAELIPGDLPTETIYIDVLGEAIEEGDEVAFEILEVYRASYEEWGCGWTPLIDDVRFVASGTEPAWAIEVSADTAVISTPDATVWGVVERLEGTAPAGWSVEGSLAGERFLLEITPDPCTNAMTGGWTPLTAHVTRGSTEYRGCAFRGVL